MNTDFESYLLQSDALMKGHFKLTSGRHSEFYFNKDRLIYNNDARKFIIDQCIKKILTDFTFSLKDIVITGPAIAGAVWGILVADKLDTQFVYPEKSENKIMVFRRGFDKMLKGKNVILIEDIVTTGNSILATIDAINNCNGNVIHIFNIINRTNWIHPSIKTDVLYYANVVSYEPDNCPLCQKNIPLQNPKEI